MKDTSKIFRKQLPFPLKITNNEQLIFDYILFTRNHKKSIRFYLHLKNVNMSPLKNFAMY